MLHKIVVSSLIMAVLVAACSTVMPSPAPIEEEPILDAGMEEETMMDEDEMSSESMAEEGMSEELTHQATFNVRIENRSPVYEFLSSGVFNTPVGAEGPGPLTPGATYEFMFSAVPGAKLSFATMFVQSNDLYYAPRETGIALFNEQGLPISGDVTNQIFLWDAGTEVNQAPGAGADQAPRQAGANTGEDENGVVQRVRDGFSYPRVTDHIIVRIEATSSTEFVARILNISMDPSMLLAPGVWVVHTGDAPIFTADQADRGEGLEALAEDGDPASLAAILEERAGVTVLLAPGVWVVHTEGEPIFIEGEVDRGVGLEALAEDGNPAELDEVLDGYMGVVSHGIFNMPVGTENPAPLGPGATYEFSFEATAGAKLSFATMFVQSNDLFYAPDPEGIELFDERGEPIRGDITSLIALWDAGTEENQEPGIGLDQAPRQSGLNTGVDENGVVRLVSDMYEYPSDAIRVTIMPEK